MSIIRLLNIIPKNHTKLLLRNDWIRKFSTEVNPVETPQVIAVKAPKVKQPKAKVVKEPKAPKPRVAKTPKEAKAPKGTKAPKAPKVKVPKEEQVKVPRPVLPVVDGSNFLVPYIVEKTGIPKKTVATVLVSFIDGIKEKVVDQGVQIRVNRLGIFHLQTYGARIKKIPNGEVKNLEPSKTLKFKPTRSLKLVSLVKKET